MLIEKEKPIDYDDQEARVLLPEEMGEQPMPLPIKIENREMVYYVY